MNEVFKDGEEILFSEPGDPQSLSMSIKRLKNDPDLRKKLAVRGKNLIQKDFTSRKIGEKLIGIFKKS